jgi:hypothetical protein
MKEKQMNVDHFIIAKVFEEEVNNPLRGKMDNLPAKKKSNPFGMNICYQRSFPKRLYVAKNIP